MSRLHHELTNINAINERRNEAVKHAATQEQRDAIDTRVFQLREAAAKGGAR
jgi:hypothetical protein